MKYCAAYVSTAVVFLVADLVWLSRTFGLYRRAIGEMMLDTPDWKAATAFYLVYMAGIMFFVVAPAHDAGSWTSAVLSGALFGLVAFATYDMTNLATLKRWSLSMSLIDMAWGMFVTSISGLSGFLALQLTGY
ncbi:MAG: DUF2177 family protein [Tardiphaga sp.]|nr:DUF2177 family protein [Tardiphaga sp.]